MNPTEHVMEVPTQAVEVGGAAALAAVLLVLGRLAAVYGVPGWWAVRWAGRTFVSPVVDAVWTFVTTTNVVGYTLLLAAQTVALLSGWWLYTGTIRTEPGVILIMLSVVAALPGLSLVFRSESQEPALTYDPVPSSGCPAETSPAVRPHEPTPQTRVADAVADLRKARYDLRPDASTLVPKTDDLMAAMITGMNSIPNSPPTIYPPPAAAKEAETPVKYSKHEWHNRLIATVLKHCYGRISDACRFFNYDDWVGVTFYNPVDTPQTRAVWAEVYKVMQTSPRKRSSLGSESLIDGVHIHIMKADADAMIAAIEQAVEPVNTEPVPATRWWQELHDLLVKWCYDSVSVYRESGGPDERTVTFRVTAARNLSPSVGLRVDGRGHLRGRHLCDWRECEGDRRYELITVSFSALTPLVVTWKAKLAEYPVASRA